MAGLNSDSPSTHDSYDQTARLTGAFQKGEKTMVRNTLSVRRQVTKALFTGLFCLLAIVWMSNPALYAQGSAAAIQGTVTDSTGAVIPGAAVTATNTETNLQRSTETGSAGFYTIPNLPPGRYRLQVTMSGFHTSISENIDLAVGQQSVLNAALQVGEIAEKVTVTAEACVTA